MISLPLSQQYQFSVDQFENKYHKIKLHIHNITINITNINSLVHTEDI